VFAGFTASILLVMNCGYCFLSLPIKPVGELAGLFLEPIKTGDVWFRAGEDWSRTLKKEVDVR